MDRIFTDVSLRETGTALLDTVMPRLCVVCRRKLILRERFICTECLAGLPRTYFSSSSHNVMADRFNEVIQRYIDGYERYSYACALFYYNSESLYKRIPRHLKYENGIASGRFFAGMLGREMASSELYADVDVVIPVPLHRWRRWSRGYNQAEVIGKEVAAALGARLRADVLVRARRTRTQTRLSVEEKARNVAAAFRVRTDAFSEEGLPCHVLLVDDVFTTGATLNACRMALREVLPPSVRISVATLAFVSVY